METSNASLSHTSGATEPPLLTTTIGDDLRRTVERHGAREALVVRHQGLRYTYDELWSAVDELARALSAKGFVKGDRIGIWAPNLAEWILTQFATARLGVILVNINPAYRTHEVSYALRQSGCRGLVAATDFKTSDYVAMVAEVRPDLPDLEHVVFIGTDDWTDLLALAGQRTPADIEAIEATLDRRRPDQHPVHLRAPPGSPRVRRSATPTS